MRTTARRIAKYNARMLSSLVDPVLSAVQTLAQTNFASFANEFVPRQEALRVIMSDEGVSVIDMLAYEACHNELFSAFKKYSGAALQAEFCILVAKWGDTAHLGAGAVAVLERIGADIYSLDACGTP